MYGSVFSFNIQPGKEAEALALLEANRSNEQRRLSNAGWQETLIFKLDNGGYMGVAVFESKEKYHANANDPAQGEWYMTFRSFLEADPVWHDGEVIATEHA